MKNELEYALSIRQPWAWAILHAGKNIENRKWLTHFRGRIRIHAGKQIDRNGINILRENCIAVPDNLPVGGFVGEVTIVDCIDKRIANIDNPWIREDYGQYGFILEDPVAYDRLIPAKGRLGIYRI